MMLAGGTIAGQALGSLMPGAMTVGDPWPGAPLDIRLNNVSSRHLVQPDSFKVNDTLGQQVTARLVIVNPTTVPTIGDHVKAVWYSEVLFSGIIVKIKKRVNNTQTARYYDCDCVDHTQILVRRKIRRNFTNLGMVGIVDALLDNELSGEGLTLGTLDRGTSIPLLSADGSRVLDLLREGAAATGQAFYVGFDKTLNFVSTSNPSFPVDLTVENVESAELSEDLDSYRNKQYVIVKGKPLSAAASDAIEVTESRQNDDQIAARAAVEGGTGIYEEYEKIEHPTSNEQADLQLLAIAYARLSVATKGVPRTTLRARIRGYGFRAGQVGTVTIPHLGVSGEWLIQRVTVTEQDGRKLVHELELVQSSLQWRAYLAWLSIVKTGKVTVLPPTAITSNSVTYNTPGADSFVVPAGVTQIEIHCSGGSGGGSYGGGSTYGPPGNGGDGGDAGLAITILDVVEGETITLAIGSAGGIVFGSPGTAGTASSATHHGSIVCQGNGGGGGGYYVSSSDYDLTRPGQDGSGIGDAVTVGGGVIGGAGGLYPGANVPSIGQDGYITIYY